MIPALILAAGLSSRMGGRDKLMEPVGGEPLIRRITLIAGEAGLLPQVALPGPDHPRARALHGLPHRALFLPGSAEGMGGTLRDGVAALPPCPRFMILLSDLPGLTVDDLRAVLAATPAWALVWRGAAGHRPGHPILCDAVLRPRFATLKGDDGGRAIMAAVWDQTILIPLPGDHAIRDLDTPDDWALWRAETGL